jgi:hypothetical protein
VKLATGVADEGGVTKAASAGCRRLTRREPVEHDERDLQQAALHVAVLVVEDHFVADAIVRCWVTELTDAIVV